MEIEVYNIEQSQNIDTVLEAINEAKKRGANIIKAESSGDHMWDYRWYRFYKKLTAEEIKEHSINKLQEQIENLKNGTR